MPAPGQADDAPRGRVGQTGPSLPTWDINGVISPYQEKAAEGGSAGAIFGLALFFVLLIRDSRVVVMVMRAGQLPLASFLGTSRWAAMGAFLGLFLRSHLLGSRPSAANNVVCADSGWLKS